MTRNLDSSGPRSRRLRHGARGVRGFTLIEIMVALVLGMLILLALTILFSRNTGNQSELERTTRQLESARFAVDTMVEDLMHAGYFGEFNPNTLALPPSYQTPDPCATAVTGLGWNTTATPVQMPVAIQGISAGAALGCLTNRRAGTEAVVVRHAETSDAITMAGGNTTNLYLQITRCALDIPRLVAAAVPAANPSTTFNLRMPDCATVNDRLRRLTQRTYYIADCNDCSANDGIPTLKRVEMIDGQLRRVSIAEGVENLQLEYGLDTNGDGQPDGYSTMGSGAITGVAPNTWDNVVATRLHVLTRNTATTTGHVDNRTYQLGPDVSVVEPADGFKRTLLSTTVRLLNVGMRRE